MLEWPTYNLINGWLVTDSNTMCPDQLSQFSKKTTVNDAEKWLARNDIRGSVRGSSFHLPTSRDLRKKDGKVRGPNLSQ